jgi:hypothetical protein
MVSRITWLAPSLNAPTTMICFWPGGQSAAENNVISIPIPGLSEEPDIMPGFFAQTLF